MGRLLEKALIGFCIFNLLIGITLASVAIWVISDSFYTSHIIGIQLFLAASFFLMIGGIVFVVTGVLGLVAIFKQLSLLAKLFVICLLVLFVFLILVGIFALVFSGEIEGKIQGTMLNTLTRDYGSLPATTSSWDKLQREFRCCGVTDRSWKIYKNTTFYKMQLQNDRVSLNRALIQYVPASCCVYNDETGTYFNVQRCQTFQLGPPGNPSTDFHNEYIFYTGCYEAAKLFLQSHSWILVGLGFVFSVVMITGIVLAIIYIRRISQDSNRGKSPK